MSSTHIKIAIEKKKEEIVQLEEDLDVLNSEAASDKE